MKWNVNYLLHERERAERIGIVQKYIYSFHYYSSLVFRHIGHIRICNVNRLSSLLLQNCVSIGLAKVNSVIKSSTEIKIENRKKRPPKWRIDHVHHVYPHCHIMMLTQFTGRHSIRMHMAVVVVVAVALSIVVLDQWAINRPASIRATILIRGIWKIMRTFNGKLFRQPLR